MKTSQYQRGLSTVSIMFIMFVVIVVATFLVRVGPFYTQHMSLKSSIKSVDESVGLNTLSNSQIRSRLSKTFGINGVDVDPKELRIKRDSSGEVTLVYDYERRTSLFLNIDIVVKFNLSDDAIEE